ncbi:MAG TPA: alpha-amylase family glycosyl hydrolase [Puia sp.]|nr:alpha-amylase family glycosyl hydrolase [Puia sp.]
MKKILLLLAGSISCLFGAAQKTPNWVKSALFFQIYPSSYQDSDGDGFGDLKGIQSRLDYIQSLGVNTIWLNPIFKSGFKDGGYDVIDFYQVDPRFGTNTGFTQLAKEIHRRGMHLILDLVAGHSSNENVWFKQSMEADSNLQHSNYYIWAPRRPSDLSPQDSAHFVEANAPRNKYYVKNYYDAQPALNYGYARLNPNHPWEQPVDAPGPRAVRRELQNIITFWLEKGADGFRVDLASSLVKSDPDKKATIALWKELNSWFDEKFPEGIMVSQWSNPKEAIAQAGFDVDFFLRPGKLVSAAEGGRKGDGKVYFDRKGEGSVADWEVYFNDQYESSVNKGYVSLPTGSHGASRMENDNHKEAADLKVLLTFVLTQPGVPLIYYGDEIGMKFLVNEPEVDGSRNRSGSRTPMQWDDSKNAGFSTAPQDKIYLPIDPDPNRPTVAKQDKDPASQLNYARALVKLRSASAAMGNDGRLKFLSDTAQPYPLVYMRYSGNEKYIIALNPSNKSVEAKIGTQGGNRVTYAAGTTESGKYTIGKTEDIIKLPAISAAIFRLE